MGTTRKDFLKTGAIAALSTSGLSAVKNFGYENLSRRKDPATDWMDFSVAHWQPNPKRVQLTRMMGVMGGVSGGGRNLAQRKKVCEDAGLKWTVLEGVNLT